MDKKRYIWVFAILILVIGGGIFAWYYFGASKNETANWQTYRNEEYYFEIKYPSGWTYQEKATQYGIFGYRTEFFDRQGKFILQIENPIPETAPTVPIQNIEKKEILIRDSSKTIGKITNYLPESGDYMAFAQWNFTEDYWRSGRISLPLYKNEIDSNLVIFDQILSTFKFIEIDETAHWKTYSNEQYGFEIKYSNRENIDFTAYRDGAREFLFGSIDCTYEGKEEAVALETIKFLPKIEGMIPNIERMPGAPHAAVRKPTTTECDELASRYIISGRFCTNKDLSKYQAWCKEGSETLDYHRYDFYLTCNDWLGESGRIQCSRLFNQIISTFKFLQ